MLLLRLAQYVTWNYLQGFFWDVVVGPWLVLALLTRCFVLKGAMDTWLPRAPHLPPLLVVHGSGSGDHQAIPVWFYLGDRFEIHTVQLSRLPWADPQEDLDVYVERLVAKLDALPFDRIHVLGISMGGLVAAKAASQRPGKVLHLITLGTPWMGSPAASLYEMEAVRYQSFKPGSPFLQDLYPLVHTLNITSIGSRCDALVPYDYAHPPQAHNTRLEHFAGHSSGLILPGVWKTLRASLCSNGATRLLRVSL